MYSIEEVRMTDPEIAAAIEKEIKRQNDHIELIASENWTSKAVMAAMGSPLTNKYAEGYSGKRYYGGCYVIDEIETIAIERAKKLFGCDYANVQPHSGAQANLAVEFAILKPGDTMMGMNLNQGGHLTHGSAANISGTYFNIVPYGVDENGFIDYDELKRIAIEAKPKLIIAGASAYGRTIDFKKFREAADACGAVLMADIAHIAGLVAAGLHPSPFPYADVVTTTTHKTLRGPRGGMILANEEAAKKYNFNKAVFPGIQGGPLEHVIAAKAVCLKEALQPEFKEYAKRFGAVVESYYPLGGRGHTEDVLGNKVVAKIAKAHGKSAAQVVLRWHVQSGYIAIPGSKNPDHIAENISIFDFELTDDEMRQIAALNTGHRYENW